MPTRASSRTFFNLGTIVVLLVPVVIFVISRVACGPGASSKAKPRASNSGGEQSARHLKDGQEMPRVMGVSGREMDPASMTRTRATRHAGGWYVLDGKALAEQPAKSLDDEASEVMDALRTPDDELKAAQKYCLSKHRFTTPCSFKPTVGIHPGGDVVFAKAEAYVPEGEAQDGVEDACADFADCFAREGLLGTRFDGFKSESDLVGSTMWRLIPLKPEEYRRQMTETIKQLSKELAVVEGQGNQETIQRLTREIESLQRDLDDHVN